jgi:hypothetical protein
LAVGEVVAAEMPLPVVVGLDLVVEHGAVLAAVTVGVALSVAVDVEAAHHPWAGEGRDRHRWGGGVEDDEACDQRRQPGGAVDLGEHQVAEHLNGQADGDVGPRVYPSGPPTTTTLNLSCITAPQPWRTSRSSIAY